MNNNINNNTSKQLQTVLFTGVTPVGTAVYPWLSVPDTKFVAEGVYKTTLELPLGAKETGDLLGTIKDCLVKSVTIAQEQNPKKKVQQAPPPVEIDSDAGVVRLKFKSKASYVTRDGNTISRKLTIVDSKGALVPSAIPVTGGSKIAIAFDVCPYYSSLVGAGITLRIKAVQVISLGDIGGNSDKDYGFNYNAEGLDIKDMIKPTEQPDSTSADSIPWNSGTGGSFRNNTASTDEEDDSTPTTSFNW